MRRSKLPHRRLCSPAYSFDKGDSSCTIVLHLKNKTKLSISDVVCSFGINSVVALCVHIYFFLGCLCGFSNPCHQ